MASIAAANFTNPPVLSRLKPSLSLEPSSTSISTLRFNTASPFSITTHGFRVSARYGGGGGGRNVAGRRQPPAEDQVLDMSSVRSDKVRLIDEQQNMIGIVSKGDAIRRAEDSELDLVVISADSDPPVVRIMNYDKFRYEQQKKKREQQKKSAASRMDLKELKMGYNIDVHDYSVRLKAAQKFLKDGDKVKVIVNLKGRGNVFLEKAIDLIKRFRTDLGELATEENNNFARRKREDITERFIFMILLPNKNIVQKPQEVPKKKPTESSNEVGTSPFEVLANAATASPSEVSADVATSSPSEVSADVATASLNEVSDGSATASSNEVSAGV